jgi:hypothetical protein
MNRLSVTLVIVAFVVLGGVLIQRAASHQGEAIPALADVPTSPAATAVDPGGTVQELDITAQPVPTESQADYELPPTPEPTPEAPTAGPVLAGETIIAEYTFEQPGAVDDWTFTRIREDALASPAWQIEAGVLRAPFPNDAIEVRNDSLTILPDSTSGATAIEVRGLAQEGGKIGVLLGYEDEQNYLALVLNTEHSQGANAPGLVVSQIANGNRVVLADEPQLIATPERWYTLRLEVDDAAVTASIDGTPVLTTELETPLTGESPGLYAGSDAPAAFNDLLVLGE